MSGLKKFSEIAASSSAIAATDYLVGVQGGTTDVRFSAMQAGRIKQIADANYFVTTTGNDTTGDGTLAKPFASIQGAWNYIVANVDGGSHIITINVGAGTFGGNPVLNAVDSIGCPGANFILIQAAGSSSTIIDPNTVNADGFQFISTLTPVFISGMKLQNSAGGGAGLYGNGPGVAFGLNGDVDFGAGWLNQITSTNNALCINFGTDYSISGGATTHLRGDSGSFDMEVGTVTITGTPAFSGAFFSGTGTLGSLYTNMTYSGSATGTRFAMTNGAGLTILNSNYSSNNDLTHLPGNAAGTSDGSGNYNGIVLGNGGKQVGDLLTGMPKGTRDFVTNATATTFASIVAGGGGNNVPVIYNGTNWIIG